MLSQREKNITKSIELMFQNMEQDDLKEVMLAIALNKSQEEKDRISEELKKQKERDLEYIKSRYENDSIENIVSEAKIISIDNIDERNISRESNKGHKGSSLINAKDIIYS